MGSRGAIRRENLQKLGSDHKPTTSSKCGVTNYVEMVLTGLADRRSNPGTRIANESNMLFLPDADYETEPWGGTSSPAMVEIEFGSPEASDSCALRCQPETAEEGGYALVPKGREQPCRGRFQLLRGRPRD